MLMPIEKKIIKALEKHGNLTTRDLIKIAGVGHSTFYKWIKRIEIDHKLVTHYKTKNEVHYMLKKPKEMSMEELDEFDKKSFENIELIIFSLLSKSKKKGSVELIDAYELSFQTLFGYLNMLNFGLLHANFKTRPDFVKSYVKQMEILLKKIANGMDKESKNLVFLRLQKYSTDREDQLSGIKKII